MTVITLSRQLGSHGEEIAAKVAQSLGLRLIDAETINRAAQRAGVPQIALAELAHEGGRSLANQMLKALRTMPSLRGPYPALFPSSTPIDRPERSSETDPDQEAGADENREAYPGLSSLSMPFTGLFSPTVPPISASLEEYVRMVGLVIRGVAHEGDAIIVGRGGQVLLKNHANVLHVQIVASFSDRIRELAAREGLNHRAAQTRLRTSDRARFDYIRRYHDSDRLDATHYHLVINTSRVPVDRAVDLIIYAQRALVQAQKQ